MEPGVRGHTRLMTTPRDRMDPFPSPAWLARVSPPPGHSASGANTRPRLIYYLLSQQVQPAENKKKSLRRPFPRRHGMHDGHTGHTYSTPSVPNNEIFRLLKNKSKYLEFFIYLIKTL